MARAVRLSLLKAYWQIQATGSAGYRVGLYTSPHLVDFRERIRINGHLISQKYVTDFFSDIREKFQSINPTFFEAVTVLAFNYFRDEKVDLAIIETNCFGF